MKYLKNIDDEVTNINDLIKVKDNQILSLALTKVNNADIRLFSLAKDEEIYNEKYEMDTIYLCLEGNLIVVENHKENTLRPHDMIAISNEYSTHLIAKEDTIMMQMMIKE